MVALTSEPCTVCTYVGVDNVLSAPGRPLCRAHADTISVEAERAKVQYQRDKLKTMFDLTPGQAIEMQRELTVATYDGFKMMAETAERVDPAIRAKYLVALLVFIRDNAQGSLNQQ